MTSSATLILLVFSCIAFAFVLSLIATPFSMLIARRVGGMDVPKDGRRMHKEPIPRLGGIAIYLSFLICDLVLQGLIRQGLFWEQNIPEMLSKLTAVLIAGTVVLALGIVDDLKNIPARFKLLWQIVSAALVFALGVRIPAVALLGWHFPEGSPGAGFVSFIVTVIWIVAITNMVNLVDGIDGLAAGIAGIAALAIAYTAFIQGYYTAAFTMAIVAGASLGFLPFNFYPAKVFMGDCGALFLGFEIAAVSIISPAKGATVVAIIAPVLVLGVPVFDMAFAMFRRLLRGKPVFEADKGHVHHQLSRIGIGQRRSALMLYGISAIMGIASIVLSRELYFEAAGLFLIAALFIITLIWGWDKRDM